MLELVELLTVPRRLAKDFADDLLKTKKLIRSPRGSAKEVLDIGKIYRILQRGDTSMLRPTLKGKKVRLLRGKVNS